MSNTELQEVVEFLSVFTSHRVRKQMPREPEAIMAAEAWKLVDEWERIYRELKDGKPKLEGVLKQTLVEDEGTRLAAEAKAKEIQAELDLEREKQKRVHDQLEEMMGKLGVETDKLVRRRKALQQMLEEKQKSTHWDAPYFIKELERQLAASAILLTELYEARIALFAALKQDVDFPVGPKIGEFEDVEEPSGKPKVIKTCVYNPGGPIEIPGSNFNVIRPGQTSVSYGVVEAKLEAGLRGTPIIPVAIDPNDGCYYLPDKHHTFVAAMAIGRPVKLVITDINFQSIVKKKSWKQCVWTNFEPAKAHKGGGGLSIKDEDRDKHEGKVESSGDWRKIVAWRKDEPSSDGGKVGAMEMMLPPVFEDQLLYGCEAQEGLAQRLYEMLRIQMVEVKLRDPFKGSSGGDWDPKKNTIELDKGLTPVEAVDMLVFESLNAHHQGKYAELQHKAHSERMDPKTFGEEKSKIEALVQNEYVEYVISCKKAGKEIAELGKRALEKCDKAVEGYSKMSAEERKLHWPELTQLFLDEPHMAKAKLPDRMALKSKELYMYEHIAVTQNIGGIKAFFKDIVPSDHLKAERFHEILGTVKQATGILFETQQLKTWAALYYDVVASWANKIFAGQVNVPVLSMDQRQVAMADYKIAGGSWLEQLQQDLKYLDENDPVVQDTSEMTIPPTDIWNNGAADEFNLVHRALSQGMTPPKVKEYVDRGGPEKYDFAWANIDLAQVQEVLGIMKAALAFMQSLEADKFPQLQDEAYKQLVAAVVKATSCTEAKARKVLTPLTNRKLFVL